MLSPPLVCTCGGSASTPLLSSLRQSCCSDITGTFTQGLLRARDRAPDGAKVATHFRVVEFDSTRPFTGSARTLELPEKGF